MSSNVDSNIHLAKLYYLKHLLFAYLISCYWVVAVIRTVCKCTNVAALLGLVLYVACIVYCKEEHITDGCMEKHVMHIVYMFSVIFLVSWEYFFLFFFF